MMQHALDDNEAALQTFQQAVRMRPDSADVLLALGIVQYTLEDDQHALETFQRALALQPDDARTHFMLGAAYDSLERLTEAQAAYERSIQLDPTDASTHHHLAYLYDHLGRCEDAITELRQAIALDPNLLEAYLPLAGIYETQGRDEEAFALLQQAVQRAPDYPDAHFALGELYVIRGDTASAQRVYELLQTLDVELAREFARRFGFAPQEKTARKGAAPAGPAHAFQLHLSLLGAHPPIWRRVLVSSATKLSKLHQVLQAVMGWTNSHLHEFEVNGERYSAPSFHLEEAKNEQRITLGQAAPEEGDSVLYLYDFGDNWELKILVEKIVPLEEGKYYPVCLGGKRATPPEDVGGLPGYEEFLDALRNPDHLEHDEMLDWVGGAFDPEAFDPEMVNQRLRMLKVA